MLDYLVRPYKYDES